MTHSIKAQIETITADKAKELLAANTSNRKIKPGSIAQIKTALQRGEWIVNGEAVKIAADGTILDGQHRLLASVETGIAFQTFVVYGLPNESQNTMDTGVARTASDVLMLNGYPGSSALSAATNAIIRAEQYSLRVGTTATGTNNYPVTRQQILERVKSEDGLQEVARTGKKYSKIGLQGRLASLLYYELTKIDGEDAEYFFDKLLTGDSLERGNPILTVRNALIDLKNNEKGARNQTYIAGLLLKAWNKFRAGEDALRIVYRVGGANPDSFPEPK